MERFFQLMQRDYSVASCLVTHIISVASVMEIDPSRPLKFPLFLGARPALSPLWPKVVVINGDRAGALQQASIEGRWTGDERARRYVAYSAAKPCIEVTLDRERGVLKFEFL